MEGGDPNPVYFVNDIHDDDSDIDSIYTTTSGFTEHTMSTLTSDAASEYFQEINGRLFPVDENVPFLFPTDNGEVQRLELQHYSLKLALGSNYFGPVQETLAENPDGRRKRVLDLLTADGSWVREMAAEFPHVDFTSIDTVPLVPHARCSNILSYEVYDLYNGIAEEDELFDVVHLRYAMSKIRDLPALILEVHRVLRPGGLFLYGEYENDAFDASTEDHSTSITAPYLTRSASLSREAFGAQGVYANACKDVPPLLDPDCALWEGEEVRKGFTGIRGEARMIPAGPWPSTPQAREAGLITQHVWCEMWRNLRPLFISHGMTAEEAEELIDGTIAELMNPGSRQLYAKYHVLYAFKPT